MHHSMIVITRPCTITTHLPKAVWYIPLTAHFTIPARYLPCYSSARWSLDLPPAIWRLTFFVPASTRFGSCFRSILLANRSLPSLHLIQQLIYVSPCSQLIHGMYCASEGRRWPVSITQRNWFSTTAFNIKNGHKEKGHALSKSKHLSVMELLPYNIPPAQKNNGVSQKIRFIH